MTRSKVEIAVDRCMKCAGKRGLEHCGDCEHGNDATCELDRAAIIEAIKVCEEHINLIIKVYEAMRVCGKVENIKTNFHGEGRPIAEVLEETKTFLANAQEYRRRFDF